MPCLRLPAHAGDSNHLVKTDRVLDDKSGYASKMAKEWRKLSSRPEIEGNPVEIAPIPGGWQIMAEGEPLAFIEANSFYLKDVKFFPDGETLVHFHQLAWPILGNDVYPYKFATNFKVTLDNRTIPMWTLTANSNDGGLSMVAGLSVTYDRHGAKYRIRQSLTVRRHYELVSERLNIGGSFKQLLEFSDPYFYHIVGPAVDMDGYWPGFYYPGQGCEVRNWRKRWTMFISEDPIGTYTGRYHHHGILSDIWHIAPGGMLGLVDDPVVGNLAYRFLSGPDCYVAKCHWGYDTHFNVLVDSEEAVSPAHGKTTLASGQQFAVEYELYFLRQEATREVLGKTTMEDITPAMAEQLNTRPIVVSGINRFDTAPELTDASAFAWERSGVGATWDKTQGYDDHFSLKLSRGSDDPIPEWSCWIGQEMFMQTLEAGKRYRLSLYVKGDHVTGEGLRIGVAFGVPRWPGIHGKLLPLEFTWADEIKGTDDWRQIELRTPPVPKGTIRARIAMELHGSGEAWLDNLLFEAL